MVEKLSVSSLEIITSLKDSIVEIPAQQLDPVFNFAGDDGHYVVSVPLFSNIY